MHLPTLPRWPAAAQDEEEEEEEPEEEGGGAGVRTGGMDVEAGEEARDDGIPVQVGRPLRLGGVGVAHVGLAGCRCALPVPPLLLGRGSTEQAG